LFLAADKNVLADTFRRLTSWLLTHNLFEARFRVVRFFKSFTTKHIEKLHSGRFSMRLSFTNTVATLSVIAALAFGFSAPANAQAVGDEFASGGTTGALAGANDRAGMNTGAQTTQLQQATAPALQGATNGTIGPQGADATYVTGLNTAGTVRVNNLANLEALLNIIANGMEILGIAWGGPTMIMGFMHMAAGTQDAMKRVLFGAAGVTGGLATPGCINWLVASARDANLFN
jgi:hypothetical protein